jgi:hypothetical protein
MTFEEQLARGRGLNGVPSFILAGHPPFSGAHPPATMVGTQHDARQPRTRRYIDGGIEAGSTRNHP